MLGRVYAIFARLPFENYKRWKEMDGISSEASDLTNTHQVSAFLSDFLFRSYKPKCAKSKIMVFRPLLGEESVPSNQFVVGVRGP